MTITLISEEQFNRLSEIQKTYPALTLQNQGYEYLDKSKFTEEDHKAYSEVTAILKAHIGSFCEFNNFKLRKDGSVAVRFQYIWDPGGTGFKGVGYLQLEELLHGFKTKDDITTLTQPGNGSQ